MIKLIFKKTKYHKNHLDEHRHFTEDDQVGEYPDEYGEQVLVDYPDNFRRYKSIEIPKKKAAPASLIGKPKKVKDEPDKALKDEKTKTK